MPGPSQQQHKTQQQRHSGLYIQAAFNGHGMSLCYKSAQALTGMLLADEAAGAAEASELAAEVDAWFPRSFRVTEERFKVKFVGRRHDKLVLAREQEALGGAEEDEALEQKCARVESVGEVLETRSQL